MTPKFLFLVMLFIVKTETDMAGVFLFMLRLTYLLLCVIPPPSAALEILTLSIVFCNLKFCVTAFYRPPNSEVAYFDAFCTIVESYGVVNYANFILVGDFNIDFYNHSHHLHSKLRCLCESLCLEQVVSEPTHCSPSGHHSLIDYVLLSDVTHLLSCVVSPPIGNSDHSSVTLILSHDRSRRSNNQKKSKGRRTVWKYAQADFVRANDLLSDIDVADLENDIDLAWSNWVTNFMDVCIPAKSVSTKYNIPWLSGDLIKAVKSKKQAYRRAMKSGNPVHWNTFKAKRNRVANQLKNAKREYLRKLDPTNPKQFWKIAKYFTK